MASATEGKTEDQGETHTSTPGSAGTSLSTVASGLAGLILESTLNKRGAIEIPSLGITLRRNAPRESAGPIQEKK